MLRQSPWTSFNLIYDTPSIRIAIVVQSPQKATTMYSNSILVKGNPALSRRKHDEGREKKWIDIPVYHRATTWQLGEVGPRCSGIWPRIVCWLTKVRVGWGSPPWSVQLQRRQIYKSVPLKWEQDPNRFNFRPSQKREEEDVNRSPDVVLGVRSTLFFPRKGVDPQRGTTGSTTGATSC